MRPAVCERTESCGERLLSPVAKRGGQGRWQGTPDGVVPRTWVGWVRRSSSHELASCSPRCLDRRRYSA